MTGGVINNFRWSDFDGVLSPSNLTVQGFVEAFEKTFYVSESTRTALNDEIAKVRLWSAIADEILSEPILDLIAAQMGFPGWEYVGKFNLVAPYDTVLKRKRQMMKHVVRLMRFRGTAYAIQQILEAFGFTSVIVTENITLDIKYDGNFSYAGWALYSGTLEHQLFSIDLTSTVDATPGPPDEQLDAIVSLANSFKKKRIELYQVTVRGPVYPGGQVRTIFTGV